MAMKITYKTTQCKCTMCGSEMETELQYGHLEVDFECGYGSGYDGDMFKVKLCDNCLDKAIHKMLSNCKVNPFNGNYMEQEYVLDLEEYQEETRKGYRNENGSYTSEYQKMQIQKLFDKGKIEKEEYEHLMECYGIEEELEEDNDYCEDCRFCNKNCDLGGMMMVEGYMVSEPWDV